jgi:hypothetical protein
MPFNEFYLGPNQLKALSHPRTGPPGRRLYHHSATSFASTLLSHQGRLLRGWRVTVQLLLDLVGALFQFQRLLAHLR